MKGKSVFDFESKRKETSYLFNTFHKILYNRNFVAFMFKTVKNQDS